MANKFGGGVVCAAWCIMVFFLLWPWLLALVWPGSPWLVALVVACCCIPCICAVGSTGSPDATCSALFVVAALASSGGTWCSYYTLIDINGPVSEEVPVGSHFQEPRTKGFYFSDGVVGKDLRKCDSNPNRLDDPCMNQVTLVPVLTSENSDQVAFMLRFSSETSLIKAASYKYENDCDIGGGVCAFRDPIISGLDDYDKNITYTLCHNIMQQNELKSSVESDGFGESDICKDHENFYFMLGDINELAKIQFQTAVLLHSIAGGFIFCCVSCAMLTQMS